MSQPHPPIPEPQPHAHGDDDPRTQSILLPPSQRPSGEPEDPTPADVPVGEPAPEWTQAPPSPGEPLPGQPAHTPPTGQFPQPDTGQFPQPGYQPSYDQAAGNATGPVDFVPGFGTDRPPASPRGSSAATLPPPRTVPTSGPTTSPGFPSATPPSGPRRSPLAAVQRAGRGGTALLSLLLGVLGLVLLEVGLALDFGNQSLWEVVPTWSAFATVAAVVVLVPAVAGLTGRLPVGTAWRAGAAGATALAVTWVLVALPLASSDRGFWLTAAVVAAGAALWLAPGRSE